MKGFGQVAAVFSEDDRVLSHKGSLGEPGGAWGRALPRESDPGEKLFGAVHFWLGFILSFSFKAPFFDLCSNWKIL